MTITHNFVSAKPPNGDDTLIDSTNWNDDHVVTGIGNVLLEQHAASTSATLDFTSFISSTYDEYAIEILNLIPATNAVELWVRMSTDGGSSYDSGSNYQSAVGFFYTGGTGVAGAASDSASAMHLGDTINSDSHYGYRGTFKAYGLQSTSLYKTILGQGVMFHGSLSKVTGFNAACDYRSTTAVNAVRFMFSSGNITSGMIRIYGIPK